jgi:transposase
MNEQYSTKRLDHLGIVAGVCEEIGLIEQIDTRMVETGRTVTVGQAVQAMVLNGLGFTSRPLYLTPEFYETKPVELLIGEGVRVEDLNSDSLGKALDYVYRAGVTELFAEVSAHALRKYGIEVRFAHMDTTAFSLEGVYDEEEGEDDERPIKITYGYSKDHRPDLKQAILGLISVNRTSIPTYLSTLSGNESDKTSMPVIGESYLEQFGEEEETPVLVADTALYSKANIETLSENRWGTRVPATIAEMQQVAAASLVEEMAKSERAGYAYREVTSRYGGVEQRWLVVYSEELARKDLEKLKKKIEREEDQLRQQIKKLIRQRFNCEADAQQALQKASQKLKFHRLQGKSLAQTRYAHPGRPSSQSATLTEWQLEIELIQDEPKITPHKAMLGKYVLATNVLDREELPADELLTVYKDQHRSVERGFRFLKDPFFFCSSFFLKKPSRIMGLLMVMGLSLLIYSLAEHHLRQQLEVTGQTIPDQKGKPTQRPTMRRVFQVFEGVTILSIRDGTHTKRIITNLRDVHQQIASLLGNSVLKFYIFEDLTL